MSDSVGYTPGFGAEIAVDEIAGIKHQRVKVQIGVDGTATDVSAANPMPITAPSALSVSGPLTDAELRAAAVPISGALTDAQLRASAVPVSAASLPLPSGAATSANQPDVRTTHPLYGDRGAVVRQAPADIWSAGFAESGSGLLATEMTQRRAGTGVTVSQSSSNLVIAAGTTANSEYLARSVASFRGAFIQRHKTILSSRIVNNNFHVMMADIVGEGLACTINSATSITVTKVAHGFTAENVGQFMFVGAINGAAGLPGRYEIASVPSVDTINFTVAGWPASGSCTVDLFGWNYIRSLYTGTTATSANIDAQRRGWNSGDTTATINTTASPGHVMNVAADGRNIYWADTLVASATAPAITTRGSRFENIPDDDVDLYLYIWSQNGTTAPASSTSWTIRFLSLEDNANVPTYIAGVRPIGGAAPLPVAGSVSASVSGTVAANLGAGTNVIGDVGQQYRANAAGAASGAHIVSAATTNATVVKNAAGRLLGWSLANTNAAWRYVKLHNQTTTPTAGTGVVRTIAIPPNGVREIAIEGGIAFTTGIALTTVTGAADADATAVGLNDIVGDLFFA
ncbi:hypothetical protein UFOVP670_45 [uncultured Caudovirales phage]|uniref:Uncharacterized protein n=1 Tax=uncultured Caudovirales phage TaxID=2100421 RepID=A0A6J5N8I2_9CAUD|nr:hypothetical protein UFOVP670_45 [uncultured Caudovirales phage]